MGSPVSALASAGIPVAAPRKVTKYYK